MIAYLSRIFLHPLILIGSGILLSVLSDHVDARDGGSFRNISMSAWEDKVGNTPLDALSQVEGWEPFTGWESKGYGSAPIWVKIQVPAADPAESDDWVLQIRPAFLDKITLQDPATGVKLETGDFLGTADDILKSIIFSFKIKPLPSARSVYLRLETTSARSRPCKTPAPRMNAGDLG